MIQRKCQMKALFLAVTLLLTACGGEGNAAATMHLIKAQGTVQVDDAKGKTVEIMENLALYSGYGVATQASSYGWINLDDTKLAKMDEGSQVEVRKDDAGKLLELYVQTGSLFFNVTEPLAEDESMDIRTSTMAVGIRGTCGWVEVGDEDLMCVYLLRGKVECTVFDDDGNVLASETITAGQAAKMVRDGEEAYVTVAEFDLQGIPGFVEEEIEGDESLAGLLEPETPDETATPESGEAESLLADYAGSYAPYSWTMEYGTGRYATESVTLHADGVVTGGATDGRSPSSVTQNDDGTIVIQFSTNEWYTVYPPGTVEGYRASILDDTLVNIEYRRHNDDPGRDDADFIATYYQEP